MSVAAQKSRGCRTYNTGIKPLQRSIGALSFIIIHQIFFRLEIDRPVWRSFGNRKDKVPLKTSGRCG
jgi:hypothetical protein